jgi:hypothetical protein
VCGTKINRYVQKPNKISVHGITVRNISKCVTPLSQDNVRSLADEWRNRVKRNRIFESYYKSIEMNYKHSAFLASGIQNINFCDE